MVPIMQKFFAHTTSMNSLEQQHYSHEMHQEHSLGNYGSSV